MPTSRPLLGFALAAVAACSAVGQAYAQEDSRAKDAFDFFKAFCVDTDGSSDRALAVIGNGNALANKLPDELVSRLQGQAGGIAWAVRSPSNAQLLLGYNPIGICEIRIAEADENAVVARFKGMAGALGAEEKNTYSNPEVRTQDGATITYRTFRFERQGKQALIALSSSDRRVAEQQHLITFGFVK